MTRTEVALRNSVHLRNGWPIVPRPIDSLHAASYAGSSLQAGSISFALRVSDYSTQGAAWPQDFYRSKLLRRSQPNDTALKTLGTVNFRHSMTSV